MMKVLCQIVTHHRVGNQLSAGILKMKFGVDIRTDIIANDQRIK